MAKVDKDKIFPHNLRHLFARIFYIKQGILQDWLIYWGTVI